MLTGGGSGGHFYPLVAVAEAINALARDKKLLTPQLIFMSDAPYDKKLLFDNDITFKKVPTGKMRRYFSLRNVSDVLKTFWGLTSGLFTVFGIYPDVIFSKGGYASLPAVFASRVLRIPLVIHESDAVAGRANRWAGKSAKRIAVSFAEAAKYFPQGRVAWTGTPVRNAIRTPLSGAHELLGLDSKIPTILVLGGSLGAEKINNAVLAALPELVRRFQVIHQTGGRNFRAVSGVAQVALHGNPNTGRYKPFDFFGDEAMRMAAGCADLVISRAGSSAIFEIALWGKPSIIIPITQSSSDHQRQNAIIYEKSGACLVVEEANLKPHIMIAEIRRILEDSGLRQRMTEGAQAFAKPEAAQTIARAIIDIALKHE